MLTTGVVKRKRRKSAKPAISRQPKRLAIRTRDVNQLYLRHQADNHERR